MHQIPIIWSRSRQRRSMLIVFRDPSTDNCTPPPLVDVKTYWEKREYFQNLVTTHNVQWFPVVGIIFLRHYNSLAVDSNCSFSSFIEFGIWKTAQNSPLMCRISWKITQSGVPDYANTSNSYGEVQTGSGPDFPNVNYGVKFQFDSDLVRGSATFRILHTPPLGWGGGHEIVGIWVKCFNFFWYLVPYG